MTKFLPVRSLMNFTMVAISTSVKLSTTPLARASDGRQRKTRAMMRWLNRRDTDEPPGSANVVGEGCRLAVADQVQLDAVLSFEGDKGLDRLLRRIDGEIVDPQQHV